MKGDCPHCGQVVEVVGKIIRKPGTKNFDHRDFTEALLRDLLKIETKPAISAGFRRYGRVTKDILAMASNKEEALRASREIVAFLDRGEMSWTLDTIAKHFLIWKANPKKYRPHSTMTYGQPPAGPKICLDCKAAKAVPSNVSDDYCAECLRARQ